MQESPARANDSTPDPEANIPATETATYAEVAVPVHVFQTFTYRIPSSLTDIARVGARIVVPLGRRLVTGYIVALHDGSTSTFEETDVKEASEVLDSLPVLTNEMLEITRWVSEYYAAPWGEVIKAALPPGISPSIDQFVKATELGRDISMSRAIPAFNKELLTQVLEDDGKSIESLAKQHGRSQTLKAVRELEREGLIERTHRSNTNFVRPKLQRVVQLSSPERDSTESDNRRVSPVVLG